MGTYSGPRRGLVKGAPAVAGAGGRTGSDRCLYKGRYRDRVCLPLRAHLQCEHWRQELTGFAGHDGQGQRYPRRVAQDLCCGMGDMGIWVYGY